MRNTSLGPRLREDDDAYTSLGPRLREDDDA